jgi:hypothetical protein
MFLAAQNHSHKSEPRTILREILVHQGQMHDKDIPMPSFEDSLVDGPGDF